MNKAQIAFASATLMFLFPWAAYPQLETSSHKILGSSCVNLRAEPSINAVVVNCLQPGTDVQVFRLPPTGRFVWVNDQAGRTWYKASVPGTNAVGWIMPACTDIFGNTTTEECADYGSVAQNPGTQGQNSPPNTSLAENTTSGASTPTTPSISSSRPSIATPPEEDPSVPQQASPSPQASTPPSPANPQSPSNQPPSTPASPHIFRVPPQTKPAVWIGRSHESYPNANGACQSWANFYGIPTNEIGITPLHLNEDPSQEVYMASCYRGNPDNSFAPVDVECQAEEGENYTAYYKYTGGTNGECVLVDSVATTPPPASSPVSQTPQQTREPSPSPTPTPPSGEPQDRREPTPSPTPTPLPQATNPSNQQPVSTPSSSDRLASERGEICEEPVEGVKPGLSRWWATAGDKNEPVISVTWTIEIPEAAGQGEYTLNIVPTAVNTWKLSGKNNGQPTVTINSGKKTQSFETETVSRNYTASLGCLKPGIHQLKIEGFQVPEKPVVEKIEFELKGKAALETLKALFIADQPEVQGAPSLIQRYAPILHFDNGRNPSGQESEGFPMPFSISETWGKYKPEKITGDLSQKFSLSSYVDAATYCGKSAIYASVNQSTNGELAINYYFHYPRSNWNYYHGFNTHEGDWEGITVFLDEKQNPKEVAFSQHVTSGRSHGGVVVPWKFLEHSKTSPDSFNFNVYVGLGAHASFPFRGVTAFNALVGTNVELHKGDHLGCHSTTEVVYLPRAGSFGDDINKVPQKDAWLLFPGRWGNGGEEADPEERSPRGPMFLDATYVPQGVQIGDDGGVGLRWLYPRTWANALFPLKPEENDVSTADQIIGLGDDSEDFLESNETRNILRGGGGNDTYRLTNPSGSFIQDSQGTVDKLYFQIAPYTFKSSLYRDPRVFGGTALIIDLNGTRAVEYTGDLFILDFFLNSSELKPGSGFIETLGVTGTIGGDLKGEEIFRHVQQLR